MSYPLPPTTEELVDSLRELTGWMRSHTGPADGTHEMLVQAVTLLENSNQRYTREFPRDPHEPRDYNDAEGVTTMADLA
jgi:hypothetical protein